MVNNFEREHRYVVIKIRDTAILTAVQRAQLEEIVSAVAQGRQQAGKNHLECVVVENDWPEYEAVWPLLEARVTGVTTAQSVAPVGGDAHG